MIPGRAMGMLAGAAALAVVLAAVPATGAPQDARSARRAPPMRGIGSFTPAAGDARLAAALARAGIDSSGFRFTPSDALRNGRRPVTVAVRARSNAPRRDADRVATITAAPEAGLAPIAYNLGVAVGWRRFALSGDVAQVDLGALPGSRRSVDLGVSYTGRRASARLQAQAQEPTDAAPRLVQADNSYAVDLGGTYALTRNLDVTAGVRYRSDADRFRVAQDTRRDSQAVYVGTAFRF